MVFSLPADLETRLASLAEQQGRDPGSLVVEAVLRMLDHDQWFRQQVEAGLAQIESGETFGHEDVGDRIERVLTKK